MSARNEDFLFAQEAQNLGYITEAQAEEGFELQRRMAEDLKIDERLAVILVKRGWLAEEQARRVHGIIEPEGARTRIEGYRIVQKVGRGAMGTVYKAIHKGLHRVVAIKILRRDLAADPTQIERLRREAKLLADLDHPNIVRAFDAGESNGFPYLVMEYVEGETLRDRIARKGRIPEEEALRITRALADALEKARRMGVVHRDVKPGNILIARSGTPKLMDLGLAKGPIDAGLTQLGATVGTPQFMSPEQAESPDKADTRSDTYSLGATLYAMVTGRPPFEGSTLAEIITKVMSQQPVPPRVLSPDVSPEVSHLIERMMLKDASLRYATPALVVADIDMILGGQSIIPKGFQGNWEAYLLRQRFLRWRRRILVGLAAAVVLGLVGYTGWQHVQKEKRRVVVHSLVGQITGPPLPEITDIEQAQTRVQARFEDAQAKRRKATELCERYGIAFPQRERVDQRLRELTTLVRAVKLVSDLRAQVGQLEQAGQYAKARKVLEENRLACAALDGAKQHWTRLARRVEGDARRALDAALAEALQKDDSSVPAFVERWKGYAAVVSGSAAERWIHDARFDALRAAALEAQRQAGEIGALFRKLEDAFAPGVLDARVAQLEFYELGRDLDQASQDLRVAVEGRLRQWPAGGPWPARGNPRPPPLTGPSGLLAVEVGRIREGIERRVQGAWESLATNVDGLPLDKAVEALERFENAAARGNGYPDLEQKARTLRTRLQHEEEARRREQDAAFGALMQDLLVAVRAGDAAGVRRIVAGAEGIRPAQQERLQGLLPMAAALEAVQAAALEHVASQVEAGGGRAVLENVPVRVPAGGFAVRRHLTVVGVRRPGPQGEAALKVRRPRHGSRSAEQDVRLADVAPATLRAWAHASPRQVAERDVRLTEIADLPPARDEPGKDLRVWLKAYREVQAHLAEMDVPAWRDFLAEQVRILDDAQFLRCQKASEYITLLTAKDVNPAKQPKRILAWTDLLLDPHGRLLYTPQVEERRALLEKNAAVAGLELKNNKLRQLFHGDVTPTQLPKGEVRFHFSFDDEPQLLNFPRGLGAWEPAGVLGTTTPRTRSANAQLRLLPDVRGFLRDRPLSLMDPFDPNRRIVLEVTIHPLRAPALLGFDLDGVQVAICSMDPNVWKRRFPPGTPLLQDEKTLPEFDFYGLGRGVAFHEGPSFGESFPLGNWDWAATGQGRNFAHLKDLGYLHKHGGALFGFDPGRKSFKVRVERVRDVVTLLVDGQEILRRQKTSWAERGGHSPSNPRVRNGSGRLQILTWTQLVIDDLRITGTPTEAWMEARRRAMAADGAAPGKDR